MRRMVVKLIFIKFIRVVLLVLLWITYLVEFSSNFFIFSLDTVVTDNDNFVYFTHQTVTTHNMFNVHPHSIFTDQDIYLFREGKHYKLYEKFGSRVIEKDGRKGVYFAVWAPHAVDVSVLGNFNGWNAEYHKLFPRWDGSGIWEGFIEGLNLGTLYKYGIRTYKGQLLEKSDPYALSWEQNVQAASLVADTWFVWNDQNWIASRDKKNKFTQPISVYEVHLGSWMRGTDDPNRFFNYREIAERLVPYVKKMGFTHVEFMPVMEHPYEPSWGYQITGFYAANSRFGSPQDLMFLIDELHKEEIGVILDWVPSHFPGDANGLHFFDGTYLYEHEDPRLGYHPEWKSHIFNYGRREVRSFLISNAMFWLDRYHADGLRVDAVTSMLYLDYARDEGQWIPNREGGNVNLEAKLFLQEFNTAVKKEFLGVLSIAEESSDFPLLTKPVDEGGIGFDMKWMMGWMHDTIRYFKIDPIARLHNHHLITFQSMYMYNEKYMMPLSHDEVVHGKASMIYKMPGDEWQKFANLRALYLYMYTHPGAKLLFMGNEFAQTNEWRFAESLSWHLLEHKVHSGMQEFIKDLNMLYRTELSMHQEQFNHTGFEWVEADDHTNSVYIYNRKSTHGEISTVILNLTPQVLDYSLPALADGDWQILLNSDDEKYAGSGVEASITKLKTRTKTGDGEVPRIQLPPLSGIVLKKLSKPPRKVAAKKSQAVEFDDSKTPKSTASAKTGRKKPTIKTGETLISASAVTGETKEEKITAKTITEAAAKSPKRTKQTSAKTSEAAADSANEVVKPAVTKEPKVTSTELSANAKAKSDKTIISANVVTDKTKEEKITAKEIESASLRRAPRAEKAAPSVKKATTARKKSTEPISESLVSASTVTNREMEEKVTSESVEKPAKTARSSAKTSVKKSTGVSASSPKTGSRANKKN